MKVKMGVEFIQNYVLQWEGVTMKWYQSAKGLPFLTVKDGRVVEYQKNVIFQN